ncbi:DNA/RNA nuclease SfsA [Clostridium sp. WILCCON 0269]|uniref:DNA/RNA nuclease SfsA n=1 Tax=Candidatus Clostridium eludens TaxID=3381663 RepID=A0ABW8SJZ2_9CLOT
MKIRNEILEGVFLEEKKNRFLCSVLIDNRIEECYIPSASKLENYIKLKHKRVLLTKNKGNENKTEYSVFAVKYYGRFIILNLSIVNKILEEYICLNYKYDYLQKEKFIGKYKADFLILNNNKTLVEAKGIIAANKKVLFPTIYSQRAIEQLKSILELLNRGWKAEYYFISLSPIINRITINRDFMYMGYRNLLKKCVDCGMLIKAFNIYYEDGSLMVKNKIKVFI